MLTLECKGSKSRSYVSSLANYKVNTPNKSSYSVIKFPIVIKPADKSCRPMAPIDSIELLIRFFLLCNDS